MGMATTEMVWQGLARTLHGFILRRVRDPHVAEDVLQDVFVKVHQGLPLLRDEERLEAWIYRIARNTITDLYRSRHIEVEATDTLPVQEPSADATAELAACVHGLVDSLPNPYREAILHAELGDLTQRELAERLGLSLSGAKSRVQRGRAKLKELLLACCEVELDASGRIADYTPRARRGCSACPGG